MKVLGSPDDRVWPASDWPVLKLEGPPAVGVAGDGDTCTLRHTVDMRASGIALLTWSLAIRPLHDALVEDAFAKAEGALGLEPRVVPWSRWVRVLRWVMSRRRSRRGATPAPQHQR